MRLKRYLVSDMREALAAIRTDLGPEAVIVQSQVHTPTGLARLWRKPKVEVLAAVEESRTSRTPSAPPPEAGPSDAPRLREIEERLDRVARSLEGLERRGPSPVSTASAVDMDTEDAGFLRAQSLSEDLVLRLTAGGPDRPEMEKRLRAALPPCRQLTLSGRRPDTVFFLGPTGVGKTTTIAKVASELATRHGHRVALVTADTFRVAAIPQIEIYADLLGMPLRVAYEPEDLAAALTDLADFDVVLVDMPGRSPADGDGLGEMERFFEAAPEARSLLLLTASSHIATMRRMAEAFRISRCEGLVFTKIDETEVFGPLVSFAVEAGKPVFYLTSGQDVPQDIEPATADRLVSLLLKTEAPEPESPRDHFVRLGAREMAKECLGARPW